MCIEVLQSFCQVSRKFVAFKTVSVSLNGLLHIRLISSINQTFIQYFSQIGWKEALFFLKIFENLFVFYECDISVVLQ